jgi:hypothetical protein
MEITTSMVNEGCKGRVLEQGRQRDTHEASRNST